MLNGASVLIHSTVISNELFVFTEAATILTPKRQKLASGRWKMAESADEAFGTVLVTGGNGIVGSHVVDAFIADGAFKRIVATQHRQNQYQNSKATYRVCDITDHLQVTALLEEVQPQVIVHTVSPGPFATPQAQRRVNYIATKQLLEAALQNRWVEVFVYTSSIEAVVLKSGFNSKPETEEEAVLNDLKTGTSAYARTKGAADALVLSFSTGTTQTNIKNSPGHFQNALLTCSLRIGGLYGERDQKTIGNLLKLVNTIGARFQIGPNEAVHDWVYTGNAARAHVLASKTLLDSSRHPSKLRVDGEAFFITDGKPVSFWEFSRRVLVEAGDSKLKRQPAVKILQVPFGVMLFIASMGEISYKVFTLGSKRPKMGRHHFDFMKNGCWFSIEKARERIGYVPLCDTYEGVRRSVKWFRKGQIESTGEAASESES